MHDSMAVSAKQGQVIKASFLAGLQRVERPSVMYINQANPNVTITLLKVKTAGLTHKLTVPCHRLLLLPLDKGTATLPDSVKTGEHLTFRGFVDIWFLLKPS